MPFDNLNLTHRSNLFNHIDLTSAYRHLPINPINDLNSIIHITPIINSNPNRHLIGTILTLSQHYTHTNSDHLDPPPPYSLISPPPVYSFLPDLILTEIFRFLFHFPDFHPFLYNPSPISPPQFPDSAFSHFITFPPRYESRYEYFQSDSEIYDFSIVISVRQRYSTQGVYGF